jgi:hypothetical protein
MSKLLHVQPEHYDELARFMGDFPGDKRGRDFWRERLDFWWEDNPAMDQDQPRGWCLEDKGVIKGFVGNIPTRMMIRGKPTVVMNATGWKVDEDQRSQSILIWLALMGAAKKLLLFCTTPNDVALKILLGLKFQPTGMPFERSNLRLTYNAPMELRLGKNVLSKLAAGALNLIGKARLGKQKPDAGFEVRQMKQAGEEVDSLWSRTAGLFDNTNLRDSASLNWYCFGHSKMQKALLGCFLGEELVGFAIFRRVGSPGDRGLECLDLWRDPSHDATVKALVLAALDYARSQSLDVVIFPHFNSSLGSSIEALGLGKVRSVDHRHYFWAGKDLAQTIQGPGTYLVGLQGDAGI